MVDFKFRGEDLSTKTKFFRAGFLAVNLSLIPKTNRGEYFLGENSHLFHKPSGQHSHPQEQKADKTGGECNWL